VVELLNREYVNAGVSVQGGAVVTVNVIVFVPAAVKHPGLAANTIYVYTPFGKVKVGLAVKN
jgi:hypothetical protein